MDLRTKLVFALVGVSLGSMLLLGIFGYNEGRNISQQASLQKLAAVAESRDQDLERIMQGWADVVALIGSRTQLRLSLAEFGRTERQSDRQLITRIIDDARASVESVDLLVVYDTLGQTVAASWANPTDQSGSSLELEEEDLVAVAGTRRPRFMDTDLDSDGRRQVRFLTPLHVDQERVGFLGALLAADELLQISRDYTGLGDTGETMIVRREPEGLRVLHPVRHEGLVGGSWVPERGDALDPTAVAAAGADTTLAVGVTDYRGREVWAATRYVQGLDWGLVVKVDAEEEGQPIVELRGRTTRLALSLSAFAILGGILLGLHLARPVRELAEVANRIRDGDTKARVKVRTRDEVGVLARTFNRMADALLVRNVAISDDDLREEVDRVREELEREESERGGEREELERGGERDGDGGAA